MANYTYQCVSCGAKQDIVVSITAGQEYGDFHPTEVCSTCDGHLMRVMETSTNIGFNGLPTPKHYGGR